VKHQVAHYEVIDAGNRVVDDFRGDRITGRVFRVIKTPKFGDPSEYEVVQSTIGTWCNCPGNVNHGKCKHLAMVDSYLAGTKES